MAGGLGPRAERLRRDGVPLDGARRRAVSTIRSAWCRKGPKIDFQLEINSYLYGTRFMTWLARTLFARASWSSGSRVTTAAARYYASQFRTCSARRSSDAWARVDRGRARRSSRRISPRSASIPLTPYDATSRAARSGRCRARIYDPRRAEIYAAFNYPGVVAHVGAIATATGAVERLVDIKGPVNLHGDVARPAIPTRAALLHDRQRRLSRLVRARSGDAAGPSC